MKTALFWSGIIQGTILFSAGLFYGIERDVILGCVLIAICKLGLKKNKEE